MLNASLDRPAGRRPFLAATVGSALAVPDLVRGAPQAATGVSLIVLGDLHYDRLDHHDWAWVEKHHPKDISQIRNYSQLTHGTMPAMLESIAAHIVRLRSSATPPAMVIQVGDLVEGLCGSEALARRQNMEALAFIQQSDLGLPFVFTKGNHDITGEGATQAFDEILLPALHRDGRRIDANGQSHGANLMLQHPQADFIFFDAYDKTSLEWLVAAVTEHRAPHLFFVVHPPVVPYGARASWHLFSNEQQTKQRAKLLEVLGAHEAIVLSGHLHKYAALTRRVASGQFRQLAVSSVVDSLTARPKDRLSGVESYDGDQVRLEPQHSPETIDQRRSIYARERPFVTAFDYAQAAGYAVVRIAGGEVEASLYCGSDPRPFQQLRLSS
jgi:hypothetical protein